MFRRPTQKQLLLRRTITLSVMFFAVIIIVTGTILFILGYRLDSNKGRIEQGALVQFDSRPNGANVSIDGKSIFSNTPSKQTVVAGTRSFKVERDQYETWTKTLAIKAGTLQWFDYIRLVPKNLPVESVAAFPTIVAAKTSPDYKWMLVQETADSPTFQLVDLRSKEIKLSPLTLDASLYTDATTAGVTHSFALIEWDQDGRYVIVKHSFKDTSEYIVVDTQDVAKSKNISTLLGISLSELKFSGTSGNTLYGLTDGTVRKLDLSNGTISRVLLTNVTQFALFDNTIITYTGTNPADANQRVAGIYREGDDAPHILRTVNDQTTALKIATTLYYNDRYFAVAEGSKLTVLTGRYPSSSDRINSFSEEGNFLVAQAGLRFVSYEVEYQRETQSRIDTSETAAHTLRWLDPAYVWAVYDGHLSIREFDGANTHVIMKVEPGFDVTLSQNGKYLYGIGKSDAGYQIQRVTMIL
jgi:hypothetical protein